MWSIPFQREDVYEETYKIKKIVCEQQNKGEYLKYIVSSTNA